MRKHTELNYNSIQEKLANILKTTKDLDADAAVVVLLRAIDHDFEVLFVKRAKKPTDPWSGQTALPGGKRNPEDQNMKQTVIRETLEETCINLLEGCRFLGAMESVRSIQRPEMKIVPFVVLQEKKQKIELNDELTGYFWTSLKGLVHCRRTIKFKLEEFPAFSIGNQVIWGLTYRIMYNLLSILSAFNSNRNAS